MNHYFKIINNFLKKNELEEIYKDLTNPSIIFDQHQNLLILGYNEFLNDSVRIILSERSKQIYDLIEKDTNLKLEDFNKNKIHIEKFISGFGFENKYEPGKENSFGILCFINDFPEMKSLKFGDIPIDNLKAGDLIIYPEIQDYTRNMNIVDKDFYAMIQWFTPKV
jgi:hypothetical protein